MPIPPLAPPVKEWENEQTPIRLAMHANGYGGIIPIIDKAKPIKGYVTMPTGEAAIRSWDPWTATNGTAVRMRDSNGLAAFDDDVDDKDAVEAINAAIVREFPYFAEAPVRYGGGFKEMRFFRTAKPFKPFGTDSYSRPGEEETHAAEYFGGLEKSRYVCVSGTRSRDKKTGEPLTKYWWRDGISLAEVPLADLPVTTKADFLRMLTIVGEVLETMGWTRKGRAAEPGAHCQHVYDLTDSMEFHCSDGSTMTLRELMDYAYDGIDLRCSASFIEGPGATNRERCQINCKKGKLNIHVHGLDETHYPASDDPKVIAPTFLEFYARLAAKSGVKS